MIISDLTICLEIVVSKDESRKLRIKAVNSHSLNLQNRSIAVMQSLIEVEKQQRFFVDNLMLGVQLADVSTRCSSHPQGKSEARCEMMSIYRRGY